MPHSLHLSTFRSLLPTGLRHSFKEADKLLSLHDLHEGHATGTKMWSVDINTLGFFWHQGRQTQRHAFSEIPYRRKLYPVFPLYL